MCPNVFRNMKISGLIAAVLTSLALSVGYASAALADSPAAFAAPAPTVPAVQPSQDRPAQLSGDARTILSGSALPLTLRLRDLNSSWRQFQVGAIDQGLSALGAYMSVLSGGQNLGGQYFTSGQTVILGDATYLTAYRLPAKQIDFSVVLGQHADYTALPDVITADSNVTLTLLNLRIIGALDNIRPFDITVLMRDANEQRARLSSILGERSDMEAQTNLRELATAVIQEAQDRNGTIPAIQTPTALKRAIFRDIHEDAKFLDPLSKRPFFANPFVAGHKIIDYPDPSAVVLLYADSPGADGLRAVAFLDGDARMVDHAEWNKLQASQHLP